MQPPLLLLSAFLTFAGLFVTPLRVVFGPLFPLALPFLNGCPPIHPPLLFCTATFFFRALSLLKFSNALLAEVYGWFTEGFDTKDLQEAKALLDSLG